MKRQRLVTGIFWAAALACGTPTSLSAQSSGQPNDALMALPSSPSGVLLAPTKPVPETFPSDIQQILDTPEDRIDTGRSALVFAHEIDPGIDVEEYSTRIDAYASEAKKIIDRQGRTDPDAIIRALNTYYHFGFSAHYDFSPNGRSDPRNYFIVGVMDTHAGQCMNLPMLYQAIAQRLGYPVFTVQAPEHSFLRFVDNRLSQDAQNIEVTGHNIGSPTNAQYTHDFNINTQAIKSGAYLRTMTRREWLGILLMENAIVFSHQGRWDRAILYLEKAQQLDPHDPYYPKNLMQAYETKAKAAPSPTLAALYEKKSARAAQRAKSLGWVVDPDAITRSEAVARRDP